MTYSATAFQLTHLLQRTYRRLKVARSSIATGGSATTIADTKLLDILGDSNEDDFLNNWTVIVVKDAGGAGADPEGKFNRISDYDDAGTITVPDTLTTAVAAGDRYMYVSPDFPLYDTIEFINDALVSLGHVPVVDTTLTTASNQTEYTLPIGINHHNIVNIEIQGITTDANDNRYYELQNWQVIPAASGTQETLVIPQLAADYDIRITYLGFHPRVDLYDDYISKYIHPEVAVSACVAHALQWYNSQRGGSDQYWKQREDRAWNQLDIARSMYPIVLPVERVEGFPAYNNASLASSDPPTTVSLL